MVRRRLVAGALVTGVITVMVAGAYLFYALQQSGPYSRADYVGIWELDGENGNRVTIDLHNDGSVLISNTPSALFSLGGYREPNWSETITLEGEWSPAGSSEIYVHTELGTPLIWAQGHDWGMSLNLVAGGDPDKSPQFTFRRR